MFDSEEAFDIVIIFPHRGEKYLSTNFFIYIV